MSADPGENEAMSARGEFMARCGDAQLTIVAYDAVVWALAEIDRLRAACVVAQEDADRQDAALRQMLDRYLAAVNLNDLAVPGLIMAAVKAQDAIAAHVSAVASRLHAEHGNPTPGVGSEPLLSDDEIRRLVALAWRTVATRPSPNCEYNHAAALNELEQFVALYDVGSGGSPT